MSTKTIHKIGSFIVTAVIAIVIIKIFPDQPYTGGALCCAMGFGLGMMRQ